MTTTRPARNASRNAWAAYADTLGITYPATANRTAIITAIDAATANAANPSLGLPAAPAAVAEVTAPPPAPELVVLIPSRGRPESVPRMVEAWRATGGFETATMLWVLNEDDPRLPDYLDELATLFPDDPVSLTLPPGTFGMAPAVNQAARQVVADLPDLFAIGILNDDHLPRTPQWSRRFVDELRDLGTGIVYGDDQLRGESLPTAWAMTTDIIRTLGRAIPALVQHLYSDNAILELGKAADCIRYLPDVVIEHVHPTAGKADWDDGYRRVNSAEQRRGDRAAFERWRTRPAKHPRPGLASHAARVRALREARADG